MISAFMSFIGLISITKVKFGGKIYNKYALNRFKSLFVFSFLLSKSPFNFSLALSF